MATSPSVPSASPRELPEGRRIPHLASRTIGSQTPKHSLHENTSPQPTIDETSKPTPGLFVTGIAAQYPPYLIGPGKLEKFAKKWYDVESPGMKKLLEINRSTGIDTRATIRSYDDAFWNRSTPPTIADLDGFFRKAGVDLTVQACKKALGEWGGAVSDITHAVGVTCTNAGNPGFDLLVAQKLGLSDDIDRVLLHGVGCAGGLAAMRAAANMASAATLRGRPARVLVFACELCSIHVRCDLDAVAANPEETKIAPALFSDGAAAFVLCNGLAPEAKGKGIYSLIDWGNAVLPGTQQHMAFLTDPIGFKITLTKEVPPLTSKAIAPMFERLLPSFPLGDKGETLGAKDFDWAMHPGGMAILQGAQRAMKLSDDQLRASYEIYKTRGNSSSATVLIVLDKLRRMGEGRENVVACAFGPGLAIEMATFKRCRKSVEL
ncbi:MAG: hypothetical protein M1839_002409 [Geoglossum umbratile]|nr:MAG: hypothetical protein M1839_002409 [Geoglossum umbratile]